MPSSGDGASSSVSVFGSGPSTGDKTSPVTDPSSAGLSSSAADEYGSAGSLYRLSDTKVTEAVVAAEEAIRFMQAMREQIAEIPAVSVRSFIVLHHTHRDAIAPVRIRLCRNTLSVLFGRNCFGVSLSLSFSCLHLFCFLLISLTFSFSLSFAFRLPRQIWVDSQFRLGARRLDRNFALVEAAARVRSLDTYRKPTKVEELVAKYR